MNQTIPQPQVAYVGVDLSKRVFHACGMSHSGRIVLEKRFTRAQLERFAGRGGDLRSGESSEHALRTGEDGSGTSDPAVAPDA